MPTRAKVAVEVNWLAAFPHGCMTAAQVFPPLCLTTFHTCPSNNSHPYSNNQRFHTRTNTHTRSHPCTDHICPLASSRPGGRNKPSAAPAFSRHCERDLRQAPHNLRRATCHILYQSATSAGARQPSCDVRSNIPRHPNTPLQKSRVIFFFSSENSDSICRSPERLVRFLRAAEPPTATPASVDSVASRLWETPNDNILITVTRLQGK